MLTCLLAVIVSLLRLDRDCTCDGRNTSLWGHLDDCPHVHWYRRGRQRLITDLITLELLRALAENAASAEMRARHANPGLAGGLDPEAVAYGVGHRLIGFLSDRHLI